MRRRREEPWWVVANAGDLSPYTRYPIEKVPTGELRGLAQAQIDRAKATLDAVLTQGTLGGLENAFLPLGALEGSRYKPMAAQISEAEDLLQDGDKQRTDRGKLNSYRSAFRVAEEATQDLIREGKLGPAYEKYPAQAKQWIVDKGTEVFEEAKKGAREGAKEVGKGLGGAAVLLLVVFLLKSSSGSNTRSRSVEEGHRGR